MEDLKGSLPKGTEVTLSTYTCQAAMPTAQCWKDMEGRKPVFSGSGGSWEQEGVERKREKKNLNMYSDFSSSGFSLEIKKCSR